MDRLRDLADVDAGLQRHRGLARALRHPDDDRRPMDGDLGRPGWPRDPDARPRSLQPHLTPTTGHRQTATAAAASPINNDPVHIARRGVRPQETEARLQRRMAEAVQRGQSDDVTAMQFGDPEPGRSALARQGVEKPLDLQRGLAERAATARRCNHSAERCC